MSNIAKAFDHGKAFISFVTAGDPSIEKTEEFILTLANAGSDLIEIGIPFSDPIAEGIVIEKANARALAVGTTMDQIFDMVKRVRTKTSVPLVFLSYMNPVFVYGIERFFAHCKECGIDGIIIPDLPFESKEDVLGEATLSGVDVITLIAPTSKERIKTLAQHATGFIYLVSSLGITGVRSEINTDLASIIQEIRAISTTPIAIGFGVSTEKQARELSQIADGVIVGSAIVKIIEQHGQNANQFLFDYVNSMKDAISEHGATVNS